MKLLSNASYHVPVIGSIRLGGVIEQDGKSLLYQNDFFTVTENHKKNGDWVDHPIQQELLSQLPVKANGRLAEIPVKVVFSDPNLNTSERFESYDPVTKRLQCVGDGINATRVGATGEKSKERCAGPEYCKFAMENTCRLMSRTTLQIRGQSDELGVFMLRSSGYNSMTTLRTRLELMYAKFGKALRYIPLKLILRAKSSVVSEDMVFYYPDLIVDGNEVDLAVLANSQMTREKGAGINMDTAETRMAQLSDHDPFMTWNDEITDFVAPAKSVAIETPCASVETSKQTEPVQTGFKLTLSQPFEFEVPTVVQPAAELTSEASDPIVTSTSIESGNVADGESVGTSPNVTALEVKNEGAKVINICGDSTPRRISRTRKVPKLPASFH